jgi:hypothetical protein
VKIIIAIVTKDRLNYFKQALESVINQDTEYLYDIYISDNSEGDDTQNYVLKNHQSIRYIRRIPNQSSAEHFQNIIDECKYKSNYFTLFHDDDLMESNYVQKMVEMALECPDFSALGSNAFYMRNDRVTSKFFFRSNIKYIKIDNKQELIKYYFETTSIGISPLPSYLYNSKYIDKNFIDSNDAGKYGDVTFLTKLVSVSAIYWLNQPLMKYRLHANNDSAKESIIDRIKLSRYLLKNNVIEKKSDLFNEIRLGIWIGYIKRSLLPGTQKISAWKIRTALIYIILNKNLISFIFNKLRNKIIK